MQVSGDWIKNPHTQLVAKIFLEAGFQIFFVGGCVRNDLLGQPVADIDMATDAVPADSIRIAEAAGLKVIPTGMDHGTVTIVADGLPHEVTTFRADMETDGRHASVAFGSSAEQDAVRRDFTMNAIYADYLGRIHDFVGGIDDLQNRIVRFIGDPNVRIQEDYLRILRFFRFYAWYGDPARGIDREGLSACAEEQHGIAKLSAERIGAEMAKLLSAPNPSMAIASMSTTGILSTILSGADPKALAPLVHLEAGVAPINWIRRAAVLGGEDPTDIWRLSRSDGKALTAIRKYLSSSEPAHELAYRLGSAMALDIVLARAAILEQPVPTDVEADVRLGSNSKFPVQAADLMPRLKGKKLGETLKELETKWIDSRFTLSRDELMRQAGQI